MDFIGDLYFSFTVFVALVSEGQVREMIYGLA